MQTKLEIKAERLLSIDKRRKAHNAALSMLHASPLPDLTATHAEAAYLMQRAHETRGLQMWRKLRRLETEAHDAATAQCNGERYGSQPFRNEDEWWHFSNGMKNRVAIIFGFVCPTGFCFNGDARGMALKLDPDKTTIPEGMQTDWGNNGLLAAEIND